ncbi:class I SAM-dependent methyltransferase, partial [Patescibacteria group bacterium]
MRKEHIIQDFIKKLPENAKVLDIGCGSGKTIRMISKLRGDISLYAVDIEDQSKKFSNLATFKKGDVSQLKDLFEHNYFDAVICQHVIEHLLSPTELVQGIKTVIKKNGNLFLETPNWTRLFIPFHKNFFWNDPTHIRPHTKNSFNQLFEENGFDTVRIKTISSARMIVKNDSIKHIGSKIKKAK